jgi:hypothetical protein
MLKAGDLVCLNKRGVEYFQSQLHFFNRDYPMSRSELDRLPRFNLKGVIVKVLRERKDSVQYQKEPLAVIVWCTVPPITTHIKARWLKKVYHH